ncbi:hypothetical protein SAICODRAFT_8720 [Saitoella complicata NRRL Y-17804]|uniref:Uncharacterized protein n=1 Tax=Saitoella complicata (strain BCRC 22490 / CBS 7301 / JCM 7358 / NBRC 10748 / NRRL Y-17804) TaxID=698492 RepID=A0A0E9NNN1_SAICN|nr:uncharacterized protein SAICODRAFT_8720 [Saitoella complicata NRRL Y-17804]ODQ51793.1 hypothetical protein SAICODRAFT_8720 [Saitoella complicata NRRL Y-17804]GAO51403.1 hypothetical protein G7K_5505-t1 [Saitoella complicata NRRL Y-17804]
MDFLQFSAVPSSSSSPLFGQASRLSLTPIVALRRGFRLEREDTYGDSSDEEELDVALLNKDWKQLERAALQLAPRDDHDSSLHDSVHALRYLVTILLDHTAKADKRVKELEKEVTALSNLDKVNASSVTSRLRSQVRDFGDAKARVEAIEAAIRKDTSRSPPSTPEVSEIDTAVSKVTGSVEAPALEKLVADSTVSALSSPGLLLDAVGKASSSLAADFVTRTELGTFFDEKIRSVSESMKSEAACNGSRDQQNDKLISTIDSISKKMDSFGKKSYSQVIAGRSAGPPPPQPRAKRPRTSPPIPQAGRGTPAPPRPPSPPESEPGVMTLGKPPLNLCLFCISETSDSFEDTRSFARDYLHLPELHASANRRGKASANPIPRPLVLRFFNKKDRDVFFRAFSVFLRQHPQPVTGYRASPDLTPTEIKTRDKLREEVNRGRASGRDLRFRDGLRIAEFRDGRFLRWVDSEAAGNSQDSAPAEPTSPAPAPAGD